MKYVVLHTIRAGQKTHRTAKLAVTDCPEKTSAHAVMSVLETAGKAADFSEAGVPWGNHEVKSASSLPSGTVGLDEVPAVTWDELQDTREVRRVTLRLPAADYGRISQAAARAGQSMQVWCHSTLMAATAPSDGKGK